jgi:hypothetical protein
MLNLTVNKSNVKRWKLLKTLLKLLIGIGNGELLSFPNMTMDRGESIIIHSPLGAENSIAVMITEDGSIRVLFSPPEVGRDFVEKSWKSTKTDMDFKERLGK